MRKFLLVIPAALMLGALMGCSNPFEAKFTGSLGNNGNGPTLPPGQPAVTSLSPSTVVAGGPAFTLTLTGVNFSPGLSVYGFGPVPVVTTYVSPTELQAQIPAGDIGGPGTETVVVTKDTLNFGATFTVTAAPFSGNSAFTVSKVDVQANDMVWDPVSQQIYLSVLSSNGANGDTITALDPSTGQLGISQNAGGEPDKLALASDGSYLYAGINATDSVQRFTLPNLGMDINIPLKWNWPGGSGTVICSCSYYALDMEAAPGNPHTIAVLGGGPVGISGGGIAIFDDATLRPTVAESANLEFMNSIQWNSSATQIYAGNNAGYNDLSLDVFSVNSSGVQAANAYPDLVGGPLRYDATTGYLYSRNGEVINPSTGTVVGNFDIQAIGGGLLSYYCGNTVYGDLMVPDGALNIAYFLGQPDSGSVPQEYIIEAFDLTHFNLIGEMQIPNVVGFPVKLIRWGTDGLAFLTGPMPTPYSPIPLPGTGVYIISGAFVTNPAIRKQGMPPMTPGMQAWAMPTRSSPNDALGSDQ